MPDIRPRRLSLSRISRAVAAMSFSHSEAPIAFDPAVPGKLVVQGTADLPLDYEKKTFYNLTIQVVETR